MSEQNDLVTKIDDLAKHIGETVHAKLSAADASELYAAKSSLKSLAYKDKVEAVDISESVLENLEGPQGPQGFGYYGGYVYKNLTLDEWKELGVLGSTHTYEVGDTSNIRIGDFGLVIGAVTDLTTTQALVNFKVTGITSNSISTVSLGFIVGEPGNVDSVDLSDLVTKEELAEFDSDVVHKTGDETVAGLKTYTSNLYSKKAAPMVVLQNTGITKGTTPSSNQTATILVSDATGTNSASSLLRIISYYTTAGDNMCRIAVYQPAAGTTWKGLDLTYKANGTTSMTWAGENVALFNSSNQLKFPNGNLLWIA